MKLAQMARCVVRGGAWDTLKVVDWEGNLRRYEFLTTAAELMLEAPGHAIVSGEEARKTRRAVAMKADERLRPGKVYLLCPVDRTGSRLPEQQMTAVETGGKRRGPVKSRRNAAGDRVFPAAVPADAYSPEEKAKEGGIERGNAAGFPRRSAIAAVPRWKPLLETIRERKESNLVAALTSIISAVRWQS